MAKKAKATQKAEPKKKVAKEVTKEAVVEECKGHSGPPCAHPDCPEWGRW